jgi:hypothetical protein
VTRVAAALLIALCAGCGHGDDAADATRFTQFELKEAGRFPFDPWSGGLPRTAHDLRRVEDRTTRQSVGTFRYDRGERLTVPPACAPVAEVPPPAFRVSWWPRDIPPSGGPPRYAFYACDAGRTFVALSVGGDTVYHWRP